MSTYTSIEAMALINKVDADKVAELANSIKTNGWQGCPILYTDAGLLTGSHRLAALNMLYDEWVAENCDNDALEAIFEADIAEDVTYLVEAAFEKYAEENDGECPELEYDNLGWIFEGTWVEEYKSEIAEW
ncbi:ParB/RepB/Spo0J family partition protein [Ruminococcaceae bacterium OttesenSCG-928-N02]|nr:ParB/RepB/Spo0J family partition protein [Ruminococcaceae bacterium OttesenSCG-928-N02]